MQPNLARLAAFAALVLSTAACAQQGRTGAAIPSAPQAAARPAISVRAFPDTTSNVHLEMVFNYSTPNVNAESGVVDMVWGSNYANKPAGVYNTAYLAYAVDDGPHPTSWFVANHHDWVEYRCDRQTPATEFGSPTEAPLDFTNPAVQAYEWGINMDAPLAKGYAGIAVDTLSLTNDWKQCGHYTSSGSWVQQFSGKVNDPTFRAAILAWAAAATAHVHARSQTATIQFNYSYEFGVSKADNLKLMTSADMIFDERGFTNWGARRNVTTESEWRGIVSAIQYVESKGQCYMTNAEEPGQTKDISPQERQWVIANYLLVKNNCTYVYMTGYNGSQQGYGVLAVFPEYSIKIGSPTGSLEAYQGIYARGFTNGLALVNPTKATVKVTLPKGTWKTTSGQTEGATVSLAGATGLVLLK